MTDKKTKPGKKWAIKLFSPATLAYFIVLVSTGITISISWILYIHTVDILTQNLRERLIGIVTTAAIQFDPKDLAQLNIEEDAQKPEWKKVVTNLINIRNTNKDIVFAYILRKLPEDESKMIFVADSHSYDPYAKVDLDENGLINDADALNWPGQEYEDVPEEAKIGYESAVTNKELYQDQWGTLISGYAPIKDKNGKTIAVMTVDIRANDFHALTRQTFYPFIFFIIGLVVILLVLAFSLIVIWKRQVDLQAEIDRQKDELLSIVSHQLASPVTSFKWYLELLLDGEIGKNKAELKEYLESMRSISADLSDLVSMILDVSRVQLGRIKIDRGEVNMSDFFKEIFDVIEPKASEKKIHFTKKVPAQLSNGFIDKRLTRMTIENLLTNAIKYTPSGGKVTISVVETDGIIHCEVKDTGMGIPKKDQQLIFGKLYRASNTRDINGNGFGLYIAKGAIESQAGKITFVSEENKGTTFIIDLPVTKEAIVRAEKK